MNPPSDSHQAPKQPEPPYAQQREQPDAQRQSGAPGKRLPTTRAIVTVTAAVGGVALLAVGVSAAYSSIAPQRYDGIDAIVGNATGEEGYHDTGDGASPVVDDGSGTQTYFASVDDVRSLDLDIAAAGFELEFGDVTEAELVASGDRAAEWTMIVEEGELSVETPARALTAGCVFNCGASGFGNATATLTLPKSMSETGTLDADISVEAGAVRGSGSFRSLDLGLEAGEIRLEGGAEHLAVDVEAGKAELDLADVATAEVAVEAGLARVSLTGEAPDRVSVDASTGSAALDLPEADYLVDAKTELGELDDRLSKSDDSKAADAQHVVTVRAEAAKVTLQ
ncbi:hypothetical protein [Leucobacter sp. NPDC077196]|uniref:hypothetical protein n=1 Tax=Leucobacter sp. NPDC077196 TaxID=3154959 RepID=UPI0034322165